MLNIGDAVDTPATHSYVDWHLNGGKMAPSGLISNESDSLDMKISSGNTFVDFFKSIVGLQSSVSLEGYMKKAESDDVVMFSESPRAASWIPLPVSRVRSLEYFGREFIPDGVCAKVRLIL